MGYIKTMSEERAVWLWMHIISWNKCILLLLKWCTLMSMHTCTVKSYMHRVNFHCSQAIFSCLAERRTNCSPEPETVTAQTAMWSNYTNTQPQSFWDKDFSPSRRSDICITVREPCPTCLTLQQLSQYSRTESRTRISRTTLKINNYILWSYKTSCHTDFC